MGKHLAQCRVDKEFYIQMELFGVAFCFRFKISEYKLVRNRQQPHRNIQ